MTALFINVPREAKIIDKIQESSTIFTLRLQFSDTQDQESFRFSPGQFNMLYLYGIGEVAISIVSDPEHDLFYDHAIRIVGRVTHALANLQKGDSVGVRGPFGRPWPMEKAIGKDVIFITGGLGCASAVSSINYIMHRRHLFGKIKILQGIKHSDDMLFKKQYEKWKKLPEVEVYIAADQSGPQWPFYTGRVTSFIEQLNIEPNNTIVMMCGPEGMIATAIEALKKIKIPESLYYLSMERNMHCAIGHCGHCQLGGKFICKDGPVFSYPEIADLFSVKGM